MPVHESERREPTWDAPAHPPAAPSDNRFAPPRSMPAEEPPPRGLLPHQKAARVIRLMAFLQLMMVVGIGAAMLLPVWSSGGRIDASLMIVVIVLAGLAVGVFLIAAGVMRRAGWARAAGILYGVLLLSGVPIGTLVGLYVLWQLVFGWSEGAGEAPPHGEVEPGLQP
jgi:hypothetical protein